MEGFGENRLVNVGDPISAGTWNSRGQRLKSLEGSVGQFMTQVGSSMGSATTKNPAAQPWDPFLSQFIGDARLLVGYNRRSYIHQGLATSDEIILIDAGSQEVTSIEFETEDFIDVAYGGTDVVDGIAKVYVYYELNSNGTVWTPTLKQADQDDWPPESQDADQAYVLVGIAEVTVDGANKDVAWWHQILRTIPVVAVYESNIATNPHPFKVRPSVAGSFTIGAGRDQSWYQVKDIISIYDRDASKLYTIEKTLPETVNASPGDIIFYKIYRDATEWHADASVGATFPGGGTDDQDALYVPIANVISSSAIGQLQFSDISVWVRPHQASFQAYSTDTGVVISDGAVHTSKNSTDAVTGATVPQGSSAWVTITVAPDLSPVVTGTVQVGAWPGYEQEAAGTLTRNVRLGKWVSAQWIPTHIGDINLGTLYQPDIPAIAQHVDGQGYTTIASNTVASVGAAKDLFFDGKTLGIDVFGGDFEKITSISDLKLGGITASTTETIITGASLNGTDLVLTNVDRTLNTEKGLTQELSDSANADIVIPLDDATTTVVEGPGIDVTEGPADTWTVTSLLDDDGTGVDITDGAAGAPHIASLDYAIIWGHLNEGPGIDVTVLGDDVTITSLLDDDGSGIDITDGAAGAPHIASLDYAIIWGHLDEGAGIDISVLGDDVTVTSLVAAGDGIDIVVGAPGAGHTFSVDVKNSIEIDLAELQLVNDAAAPGNKQVYSTTGAGVKGWQGIDSLVCVEDSLEFDAISDCIQLLNDADAPGAYTLYGALTNAVGAQAWQDMFDYHTSSDTLLLTSTVGALIEHEVITQMSLTSDASGVKLSGDEDSPGNGAYYGTNCSGTKGWQDLESLEGEALKWDTIGCVFDVKYQSSIAYDTLNNALELDGDEFSPGNWSTYATDGAGAKGWQDTTQITVVTDVQLDGSNNLQIKTRTIQALNAGTESAFTTVTGWATTTC